MRLSKATLGAFAKYPVTAADRAALLKSGLAETAALKKFGIFGQDLAAFAAAAESLGLPEYVMPAARTPESAQPAQRAWARHPLVFLMEAADDITYNIVDIEDAFTTGELGYDSVLALLSRLAGVPRPTDSGMTESEAIAMLRARSIGTAIDACVETFITHYDAIMEGRFAGDLVGASPLAEAFGLLRETARSRIFTAPRKTELELSGRRIIANVMSGIAPVYEELAAADWHPEGLSQHGQQLVRALSLDLRDIKDPVAALHALADFTSGMTDRYALRISRMLSGT
ncbi:hypothetical protein [Pseudogemmobacter hezensis]|uniref:hypothetical protein n=1 Tax=Pseudogemmobacter hezensis TaxID=2737662 RepID=UPI0020A6B966|nr:hypothetical protein [Pseudogemmobacter hezensis]